MIPARLSSSRFPKKILALLQGKPLLQWVWEAATKVPIFDSVTIAIDSRETEEVVRKFGGNYRMTAQECPNGTLRLCDLIKNHPKWFMGFSDTTALLMHLHIFANVPAISGGLLQVRAPRSFARVDGWLSQAWEEASSISSQAWWFSKWARK